MVKPVDSRFRGNDGRGAGVTEPAAHILHRHSRESGNLPEGIVVSKDQRAGIYVQFGHLSPYPNTNAGTRLPALHVRRHPAPRWRSWHQADRLRFQGSLDPRATPIAAPSSSAATPIPSPGRLRSVEVLGSSPCCAGMSRSSSSSRSSCPRKERTRPIPRVGAEGAGLRGERRRDARQRGGPARARERQLR